MPMPKGYHPYGDNVTKHTARGRARSLYPLPHKEKKENGTGLERHHIDGNPYNNAPENIAFVTRKEHVRLDKRLIKTTEKANEANRKMMQTWLPCLFPECTTKHRNKMSLANHLTRRHHANDLRKLLDEKNQKFINKPLAVQILTGVYPH